MTRYLHKILVILAALAALTLGAVAVWYGALNQDEGWYLYAAQLVRAGKLPYHDFFFTQGPTLPIVYSFLSPLWTSPASPLHGVLGGRVVSLAFGLAGVLVFAGVARLLVRRERRFEAAFAVFAMLACNVYHLYFLTIPKTYALGSFFTAVGFYFLVSALSRDGWSRAMQLVASGLAMAFASGTRISLVLMIGVTGFALLFNFRRFRYGFIWFGIGGSVGLFLTYGVFALDPASLQGLLAAQEYHAARGGFDLMFAVGSVSRLARAYVGALAVLALVVAGAICRAKPCTAEGQADGEGGQPENAWFLLWTIGAAFAAVFVLQLSAPFPYDDYQVPVMGLLAVVAAVLFASRRAAQDGAGALRGSVFVFLATCVASFGSPQLQQWFVAGQDRFWTVMKGKSDLAELRDAARKIEELDPGGKTLFTQDLYLAVECGRTVPEGLEMGPFSYFPGAFDVEAEALHVMNTARMAKLIESAPAPVAAFSGYGFAIAAPKCVQVPHEDQMEFWERLKEKYSLAATIPFFGQNDTTLVVLKRNGAVPPEGQDMGKEPSDGNP